jgi:type I restriction enzyme, S subunit
MTQETKKLPLLRFPEFTDAFCSKNLKDLSKSGFSNGVFNDPEKIGRGYRLINVKDMYVGSSIDVEALSLIHLDKKLFERNQVKFGDIFFTRSSLVREGIAYSNVNLSRAPDITFDGHLIKMTPNLDLVSPEFLSYALRTSSIRRQLVAGGKTTTMTTIGQEEIGNVSVFLPSVVEQGKIAAFLLAVDKKIAQLTKKKQLLLEYKKGVTRQIFDQNIRFKDDNGNNYPDWEPKELKEISDRVKKKNTTNEINFVLTNSAMKGIVSQTDYFDKDIANPNNLTGYYVVDKDDFVYNPRISTLSPVGPIKRNNLRKGVMSPLYMVFRLKYVDLDFSEFFFDTNNWHDYMRSIANFGARHDRMNITTESFFEMPILVPSREEQEKIAKFLQTLDKKIQLADRQLEETKNFKKGLLQQMFV